jgi:hypothetical protein
MVDRGNDRLVVDHVEGGLVPVGHSGKDTVRGVNVSIRKSRDWVCQRAA